MLTRRTFLQSALLLPVVLTRPVRADDAAPAALREAGEFAVR